MKKFEPFLFLFIFVCISILNAYVKSGVLSGLIIMSCIWSILALSMSLLVGYAGQVSLGHAGFFAIGAYTSALLLKSSQIPYIFCIIMSASLAGMIGILLGIPCLRIKGFYLAIATLAFGEIVYVLCGEFTTLTGGYSGLSGIPYANFGPIVFKPTGNYIYLVIVITFLSLLSGHRLVYSRTGRALTALKLSEPASISVGVNIRKLKVLLFGMTAMYCGVAGSLFAHYMLFLSPEYFTGTIPLMAFAACAIGGIGTIWGSFIGGTILTIIPFVLESYKEYQPIIWASIVISIMVFMPRGLFNGILDLIVHGKNPIKIPEVLSNAFSRANRGKNLNTARKLKIESK